jgi:hypothetical protein
VNVIIDWLSFTVPIYAGVSNPEGFAVRVENGLYDMFGQDIVEQVFGGKWNERKGGRAPYSNSYDIAQSGAVVFLNPTVDHVLVELSGQACDRIRNMDLLSHILELSQNRITRLDLACDIETPTTPVEFAPEAQYATTTTYSAIRSKTGETVYIGSTASERYTRVYRYAPPHPRSRYLRVEFVFRRKVARTIAQEILVQGLMAVAAWSGDKTHFRHIAWSPTDQSDDIRPFAKQTMKQANTFYWLVNVVAPAFRTLVLKGDIPDPEAFIRNYFLPDDLTV